jgi:hypothetical protein
MAQSNIQGTTFGEQEVNNLRNGIFQNQHISNMFVILVPELFGVLFTSGLLEAMRPLIVLTEEQRPILEQTLWDNPALVPVEIRNDPDFERISNEISLLFDIFSVIFNLTSQDIQNDQEFGKIYQIGNMRMLSIRSITRDQAFMLSGAHYIKTAEVLFPSEDQ